jgi:hypothetical protein
LKKEVLLHIKSGNKSIFVPFLDINSPWSIPDFYFAVDVDHGIKLAKVMTSKKKFHRSVHVDLFLKQFLLVKPDLFLSQFPSLFFNSAPKSALESVVRSNIREMFSPGTKDLFYETKWRGNYLIHDSQDFIFSSDVRLSLINLTSTTRDRLMDINQALSFVFEDSSIARLSLKSLYWRLIIGFKQTKSWLSRVKNRIKYMTHKTV